MVPGGGSWGGLLSFGWYDVFLSLAEHGGLELACMQKQIKHKIGYLLGFFGSKIGWTPRPWYTSCDPIPIYDTCM